MPTDYKKYTDPKLDGRVKILPEQHEEIRRTYKKLQSYNATARLYGVSKRLIIFIVNPEKYQAYLKHNAERKAWEIYYDRVEHTEAIKKYRAKKRSLNLHFNRKR